MSFFCTHFTINWNQAIVLMFNVNVRRGNMRTIANLTVISVLLYMGQRLLNHWPFYFNPI